MYAITTETLSYTPDESEDRKWLEANLSDPELETLLLDVIEVWGDVPINEMWSRMYLRYEFALLRGARH